MNKHSRYRHDVNEDNYNSSNTHDSRYGGNRRSRRPSLFSDRPVNRYSGDNYNKKDSYSGLIRSPGIFRRGGGGHRPFDSPPRQFPSGGGGGGFRPMDGGSFRPMDGVGGFGLNYQAPTPPGPPSLSGQKRGFRYPGCCFVKFATVEEGDRAIRALRNQHTLPGGEFREWVPSKSDLLMGSESALEPGYAQLPVAASSVNYPNRFQQSGQEWMWKNKPVGPDHLHDGTLEDVPSSKRVGASRISMVINMHGRLATHALIVY